MEKYEIIEELGSGCFGRAYKVLNRDNNQIYVMKKFLNNKVEEYLKKKQKKLN